MLGFSFPWLAAFLSSGATPGGCSPRVSGRLRAQPAAGSKLTLLLFLQTVTVKRRAIFDKLARNFFKGKDQYLALKTELAEVKGTAFPLSVLFYTFSRRLLTRGDLAATAPDPAEVQSLKEQLAKAQGKLI